MGLHSAVSWTDFSPSKMAVDLFSLSLSPPLALCPFLPPFLSLSLFLCLSLLLSLSLSGFLSLSGRSTVY